MSPLSSVSISPALIPSPLVSVLVPICNVERYLAKCLDSLRAQSFTDFEVLCINDGSTDGSRDIILRYLEDDRRFRMIDKPNSGYGSSMNLGLSCSLGEYIAILESDDFFEPNALELLVQSAKENDSDVVKADFYLYWSAPSPHDEVFHIVDDLEIGRTMRPIDDLAIFFRKPSIWSALYKKSFLTDNRIDFLETPGASYQDAGFNFKVWASANRATFIANPILHYRQDNEKSSVNSSSKVFCVCDEYESMMAYVEERCCGDVRLIGILERMKFDSYMWNYDRLSSDLRPAFVKRASLEFASDIGSGKLDFSLFEPGAEADLRLLVQDPERFMSLRDRISEPGAMSSLLRFFRLGGISLVAKAVVYKLTKKSVRRLNYLGGAE